MSKREVGLFAGIVVAIVLLFVGIYALVTALSPVTGKASAYRAKNDGTNRVIAQERFEDRYQDILAADKRIDVMARALKARPGSVVAQTNYDGAVNYCLTAVAGYNADARKYSAEDFRSLDLPAQIDDLDSTTDCKETSK